MEAIQDSICIYQQSISHLFCLYSFLDCFNTFWIDKVGIYFNFKNFLIGNSIFFYRSQINMKTIK